MDKNKIAKELLAVAKELVADVDDVQDDVLELLKKNRVPLDERSISVFQSKLAKKADSVARKIWKMAKELGWKGRPESFTRNELALEDLLGWVYELEYERTLGSRHDDAWTEDRVEQALEEKKEEIIKIADDIENNYSNYLIILSAAIDDLRM